MSPECEVWHEIYGLALKKRRYVSSGGQGSRPRYRQNIRWKKKEEKETDNRKRDGESTFKTGSFVPRRGQDIVQFQWRNGFHPTIRCIDNGVDRLVTILLSQFQRAGWKRMTRHGYLHFDAVVVAITPLQPRAIKTPRILTIHHSQTYFFIHLFFPPVFPYVLFFFFFNRQYTRYPVRVFSIFLLPRSGEDFSGINISAGFRIVRIIPVKRRWTLPGNSL